MKKIFFVLLTLIILPSCSSVKTLTESQRSELSNGISIVPAVIEPNSYKEPDGTASPNASTAIPLATAGGLLPALLGMFIDTAVMSSQQKAFKKENEQYFDLVKSSMPSTNDLITTTTNEISSTINSNVFFSNKIKDNSETQFIITIKNYGLTRQDKTEDIIAMAFTLGLTLELVQPNKEPIITEFFSGSSDSAYSMKEYIEKCSLLNSTIKESIKNITNQIELFLAKTTELK